MPIKASLLALIFFLFLGSIEQARAEGSFQAPLTTSPCTEISGTVGTSATIVVGPPGTNKIVGFLQIHNPAAFGGNYIAFTLDGSAPVINGNGFTLPPMATYTYDNWVPFGAIITLIGSASGSAYTICEG